MKITLKGDAVAEVEKGITIYKLAENMSARLLKSLICGKINGKLYNLNTKITKNCKVEFVYEKDSDAELVIMNSAKQVLAQAVKSAYPSVKLASSGIKDGLFYYDFDFKTAFNPENLSVIEDEMKRIINAGFEFSSLKISKDEAIAMLEELTEPFKLEMIADEPDDNINLTVDGDFVDIENGVFLQNTNQIKYFKLLKVETVYWQDNVSNKKLTRMYGTANFNQKKLTTFCNNFIESQKRNHIKIGQEMKLFLFDEKTNAGEPFWLQNGINLTNSLISYERQLQLKYGYTEISAPLMISDDYTKYTSTCKSSDAYKFLTSDGIKLGIKAKNCPQAFNVCKTMLKTEEDLPIRIACYDYLHRNEPSEKIDGLFTLRSFRQDESHNFITVNELTKELDHLFELTNIIYKAFDLTYTIKVTTPKLAKNSKSVYQELNLVVKDYLTAKFGGNSFVFIAESCVEAIKIDLVLRDAIGREFQVSSFVIDANAAENFNLFYLNNDGKKTYPIVIHRMIYGSIERFVALITEHFNGDFPFWLAPIQVGIAVKNLKAQKYATKILELLTAIGIRGKLINKKYEHAIDEYIAYKVPYIFTLGLDDLKNKTITVKIRNDGTLEGKEAKYILEKLNELNLTKSSSIVDIFSES